MIENLQREDLNPIEVATVYQRFVDDFGYTHEALAKKIGVEQEFCHQLRKAPQAPGMDTASDPDGKLTQGHGRVLLTLKTKKSNENT